MPIMDSFLAYILRITALLNFPKNINVIIGNESCDLDSTVSALALAYFMNENGNKEDDSVTLPVLNVPKEEFMFRVENLYVLNKIGINTSSLYYKDTLNIKDLIDKHNVKVTLVDHHVLSSEQQYLKPNVVGIFDHRPVDPNARYGDNVNINIKLVGSCTTLITEEILSKNSNLLSTSLAQILYDTIIFDSIGLSPDAGKVKDLDVEMIKNLERFLDIEQPNHQEAFDVLWSVHNDVSHLTPKQLLMKDLKIVDKILVPGLPMLVKDYLKLPDIIQVLQEFCESKNGTIVILMGLAAKDGRTERDLGFYSLNEDSQLLEFIVDNLKDNSLLQLIKECSNVEGVKYFKQNYKPSRKQLLPLVKEILIRFNSSNI